LVKSTFNGNLVFTQYSLDLFEVIKQSNFYECLRKRKKLI
jgi:hypothetical protein